MNNIIDAKTFFKIGPEIYPLYGQLVHFAAFKHKNHDQLDEIQLIP